MTRFSIAFFSLLIFFCQSTLAIYGEEPWQIVYRQQTIPYIPKPIFYPRHSEQALRALVRIRDIPEALLKLPEVALRQQLREAKTPARQTLLLDALGYQQIRRELDARHSFYVYIEHENWRYYMRECLDYLETMRVILERHRQSMCNVMCDINPLYFCFDPQRLNYDFDINQTHPHTPSSQIWTRLILDVHTVFKELFPNGERDYSLILSILNITIRPNNEAPSHTINNIAARRFLRLWEASKTKKHKQEVLEALHASGGRCIDGINHALLPLEVSILSQETAEYTLGTQLSVLFQEHKCAFIEQHSEFHNPEVQTELSVFLRQRVRLGFGLTGPYARPRYPQMAGAHNQQFLFPDALMYRFFYGERNVRVGYHSHKTANFLPFTAEEMISVAKAGHAGGKLWLLDKYCAAHPILAPFHRSVFQELDPENIFFALHKEEANCYKLALFEFILREYGYLTNPDKKFAQYGL